MGTKQNPGKFDCYFKAGLDEPIFTLRGNDPIGWLLVKLWVEIRTQMSADKEISKELQEKLDEALVASADMRAYAQTQERDVSKASIAFRDLFKRV